jgi:hypothetical protein
MSRLGWLEGVPDVSALLTCVIIRGRREPLCGTPHFAGARALRDNANSTTEKDGR